MKPRRLRAGRSRLGARVGEGLVWSGTARTNPTRLPTAPSRVRAGQGGRGCSDESVLNLWNASRGDVFQNFFPLKPVSCLHLGTRCYDPRPQLMKKVEAIIKPFKLEAVKDALSSVGVEGM